MRRALQAILLVAIAMTIGCAIYPPNTPSNYTILTFKITMAAPIPSLNSTTDLIPGQNGSLYQYYLVMTLYTSVGEANMIPSGQQVTPVLSTNPQQGGSLNGVFTGIATNVISYNLNSSGSPNWVYNLQTTPTLNWGNYGILSYFAGYTNDQLPVLDSNENYPATWTVTVPMNELQTTNPQTYTYITFQVISMSAPAGQSGRFIGALGSNPGGAVFDQTVPEPINTSTTWTFSQPAPSTFPSGGDQALAIQNVTLQVQVP